MDYNSVLELVKKTRSIPRFKADPIPEKYIDQIIEVARWAPSGFNQQPWDFIVVRKPELKNKIVEYCRASGAQAGPMEIDREAWQKGPKWTPGKEENDYSIAPVYIILCGDNRTKAGLPMALRYNPDRMQNTFISGLASQWVSSASFSYAHCMIKE
jgi:nitroreductase